MEAQGHAPFVWSVLGGIARAKSRIAIGTGVTCPTVRIHSAIVAQASATAAAMPPGRFVLGAGELLNKHVTGRYWPPVSVRLEAKIVPPRSRRTSRSIPVAPRW